MSRAALLCTKCRGSRARVHGPAVVHTPDGPRCRGCFLDGVRATFRTALARDGRPKFTPCVHGQENANGAGGGGAERGGVGNGGERVGGAPPRERMQHTRVGLAFSGGAASVGMLHLMRDLARTSETKFAKRYHVVVLCVGADGSQIHVDRVTALASQIWPEAEIARTTLQDAVGRSTAEKLERIRDTTDKEFLRGEFVRDSLTELARSRHCELVLLGHTSTRLAIDSLANTVTGRGPPFPAEGHLPAIADRARLSRPLKDISSRQIARYNHLTGIDGVFRFHEPDVRNLQSLTARFVLELQDQKSSTVPTVLRTFAKVPVTTPKDNQATCPLCKSIANADDVICYACAQIAERAGSSARLVEQRDSRLAALESISEFIL